MAACGPYPDDISGTLDGIERSGRLRVGMIELRGDDEPVARDFITRLEAATGARAEIDAAPLETQLVRLENGALDLVVAEFREDTPWAGSVAILEPLATRHVGKDRLGLAPAAMNGENRWVALLEREIRNSRARSRP